MSCFSIHGLVPATVSPLGLPYRIVVTCRSDPFAVGTETDGINAKGMAQLEEDFGGVGGRAGRLGNGMADEREVEQGEDY